MKKKYLTKFRTNNPIAKNRRLQEQQIARNRNLQKIAIGTNIQQNTKSPQWATN